MRDVEWGVGRSVPCHCHSRPGALHALRGVWVCVCVCGVIGVSLITADSKALGSNKTLDLQMRLCTAEEECQCLCCPWCSMHSQLHLYVTSIICTVAIAIPKRKHCWYRVGYWQWHTHQCLRLILFAKASILVGNIRSFSYRVTWSVC